MSVLAKCTSRRGVIRFAHTPDESLSQAIRSATIRISPQNRNQFAFSRRSVSRIKTLVVPVKVVVREGEPLPSALWRLRMQARWAYRRQWSKTRPGAYEKPSYRRRKRESLRRRNASTVRYHKRTGGRCTVYIGLPQLMSREEVYQRKRRPFKPHRRWWGDKE